MTVYRVTIRGRFHQLSDKAKRYLVDARPEHDIFKSAYTPEGTLTYEDAIDFFNLRYELRIDGDSEEAGEEGLAEAKMFLETLGFGYRDLKVSTVDMSQMWDD